ncbi:uncharacterized protein BXZ73DRAFT_50778, partial [Epithele typhae]|uniref:uncharacterized protein n=1 Tax=Epithele typhae TaxID=378194 RepID=UPI0020082F08
AMPSDISFVNAHLVGLLANTFATGFYVAYVPQSVSILWSKWRAGLSGWLPFACGIIFVLALADWWSELVLGYNAFGLRDGEQLANPAKALANISAPVTLTKGVFTAMLAMFSDLIIVYRALIVWNYNLYVAFVAIGLLLASYALGIWSVWTQFQTGIRTVGVLVAEVSVRVKYFFIVTFVLNALCAGLIAYKIWSVTRMTGKHIRDESPVSRIMEIVIESAALYCANLLALIVSNIVASNVFFIFLQPVRPPPRLRLCVSRADLLPVPAPQLPAVNVSPARSSPSPPR